MGKSRLLVVEAGTIHFQLLSFLTNAHGTVQSGRLAASASEMLYCVTEEEQQKLTACMESPKPRMLSAFKPPNSVHTSLHEYSIIERIRAVCTSAPNARLGGISLARRRHSFVGLITISFTPSSHILIWGPTSAYVIFLSRQHSPCNIYFRYDACMQYPSCSRGQRPRPLFFVWSAFSRPDDTQRHMTKTSQNLAQLIAQGLVTIWTPDSSWNLNITMKLFPC